MANHNYATMEGKSTKTSNKYYIGLVQHNSSMPKNETYEYLAEKLKYSVANIKAVFLACGKAIKANANKGYDTIADDIAHFKIYARGSVPSSTGPWVQGINSLVVNPLEAEQLKNALSGIIPVNVTEGLVPAITSVLDTVTGEYDIITGTDIVSIGGTNLGPDQTKTDEKVYALFDDGTTLPMTITSSTLTLVKAKFASTPAKTGKAKIVVATRCGLGEDFGVKTATRIIEIK